MSEGLDFLLRLRDAMSSPAASAQRALKGVKQQLDAINGADVVQATKGIDDLQAVLAPVTSRFAAAAQAAMVFVGAATAVGAAVGYTSYRLGRGLVELAAYRESTLTTFETMLHSREGARDLYEELLRTADVTPFTTRTVMDAGRALVAAGFRDREELRRMLAFVSDVGASRPGDTTIVDSVVTQLGQVRALGSLTWEDMRQITQASGINAGSVMDQIGRQMGVRGSQDAVRRQVQRLMEERRVTDQVGIRAMMDALGSANGPLGSLTQQQSQTLTGLLSTAGDRIEGLILRMDLASTPGMMRFRGVLTQVIDLLGPGTQYAQRLQGIVLSLSDGLFTTVFGDLDQGASAEQVLVRVLDTVTALKDGFLGSLSAVRGFLGGFGEGFGRALPAMGDALRMLRENGPGTAEAFRRLGDSVGATLGGLATTLSRLLQYLDTAATTLDRIGTVAGWSLRLSPAGAIVGGIDALGQVLGGGGAETPPPVVSRQSPASQAAASAGTGGGVRQENRFNVTVNVGAGASAGEVSQAVQDGLTSGASEILYSMGGAS